MKFTAIPLCLALLAGSAYCAGGPFVQVADAPQVKSPFVWENATVYFVLTDRFYRAGGNKSLPYGRKDDAAPLRGYLGGNLAGVTAKLKAGYFDDLGVDVIWISPPVEQIHAGTDEGDGKSYAFHGYWARDWTSIDASLGNEDDIRELVDTAHAHGIRVLLDVVMNHTGPVTQDDTVWPDGWVRTGPPCTYKDVESTVRCTLVKNLPDLRTESMDNVALPPFLVEKWKKEGRLEKEVRELDEFFTRTGYPRAPRYYLMKWHADWVSKYGFDGFRADTVKHVDPEAWKELKQVASAAYEDWKRAHPQQKLGDQAFYMTAEVYGYNIATGRQFTMDGGSRVDYFDHGFDSLINFGFKSDAKLDYETLFSSYAAQLNGALHGYSVLNYLSSHDDTHSFDRERLHPLEAGTKLLLSPGAAQIYYGDETARLLIDPNAQGDAQLRTPMNWDELSANIVRNGYGVAEVRRHWSKLGLFRHAHPAIGAGAHRKLADHPYTFTRSYDRNGIHDKVVIALDVPAGEHPAISVAGVFADGQTLKDYYSGSSATVAAGKVRFAANGPVVLIGQE